jgi:hypothetical protein
MLQPSGSSLSPGTGKTSLCLPKCTGVTTPCPHKAGEVTSFPISEWLSVPFPNFGWALLYSRPGVSLTPTLNLQSCLLQVSHDCPGLPAARFPVYCNIVHCTFSYHSGIAVGDLYSFSLCVSAFHTYSMVDCCYTYFYFDLWYLKILSLLLHVSLISRGHWPWVRVESIRFRFAFLLYSGFYKLC